MNDQKINRKLALAIGWKPRFIFEADGKVFCKRLLYKDPFGLRRIWQVFDYRDWATISPIAQRYDCFPEKSMCGDWAGYLPNSKLDTIYAGTPQKAIALSVIAAHEAGVLK